MDTNKNQMANLSSLQVKFNSQIIDVYVFIDIYNIYRKINLVIEDRDTIHKVFQFLLCIDHFTSFLHKTIDTIKKKTQDNGQELKKIQLNIEWEDIGLTNIKVKIISKEGSHAEYRYKHTIPFTSFSYKKLVSIKGLELKRALENEKQIRLKKQLLYFIISRVLIYIPLLLLLVKLLRAYSLAMS